MNTPPVPSPLSGGRLVVDLGALVANWRRCAAQAGPAETAGVLKADAYGCGAARVGPALAAAGCRTFFVALPGEGIALRSVLPEAVIYVLGGFPAGAGAAYVRHRLRPVLGSTDDVASWLEESGGAALPVALHVDTGMNRLGLTLDEARRLAADTGALERLAPALLMSHLAAADDPAHPLTGRQIDAFEQARSVFPGVPSSLANSAGLFRHAAARYDLVRPGIAVYGGRFAADRPPLAPVATAEARIVQVRTVRPGDAVGYGAAFVARRASRIAIASVGYADGYPRRAFEAGAEVAVGGARTPLAGRISMDLLAVDVTDVPAARCRRGDVVELFGPTIPVDEVAARCGTIGYELLTAIGPRLERLSI